MDQAMETSFANNFLKGLAKHLDSEQFADFEFRCDGHRFKVHKLIVSSHSSVLMKACTGAFKEAYENSMDFPDEDPTYIKALISGMYRLDYADDVDLSGNPVSPFVFNANIYAIAEKYDIPALKLLSAQKFRELKSRFSLDQQADPLKQSAMSLDIVAFGEAVRITFTSTPASDKLLREIALDMTMDHVDMLLDSEAFCEEVEDAPGFGIKVAMRMKRQVADRKAAHPTYKCLRCAARWTPVQQTTYYGYCPACGNRSGSIETVLM